MEFCSVCNSRLITTMNANIVCSSCGVLARQQLVSYITPRDWLTDPLMNVYSRKKRFKALTENLFLPHASTKDNKMMAYLTPLAPFPNKDDLLQSLKLSKLGDKRYCSIHYFCKAFVSNYRGPRVLKDVHQVIKILVNRFGDIECVFSRLFPTVQFFNYAWLLSKLLAEFRLNDFIFFVKELKCKQRVTYYSLMLQEIVGLLNSSDSFYPVTTF